MKSAHLFAIASMMSIGAQSYDRTYSSPIVAPEPRKPSKSYKQRMDDFIMSLIVSNGQCNNGSKFEIRGFVIRAINYKNADKKLRKLLGAQNLDTMMTKEELKKQYQNQS